MGKLVMGYWDCPVCGGKGIAGNVMNCPSCGRARGDVKFYMKDGAENAAREENERGDIEYLSQEQSQEFSRNPDWYCSFCNSLNKDNAAFCSNCGATRESSESNYFDRLKKREEAEKAEKAAQSQPAAPAKKKSRLPLLLIILAAVVGLIIYMSGSRTQGGLKVTGFAWSRSIPVEQYRQFTETGWEIPAGGTEVSRARAIHHYDQVLDHYEDYEVQRSRQVLDHYETDYTYTNLGNGAFEEVPHVRPVYRTEYYTETKSRPVYVPVPRYQTQYTYTIWRWVQVRTADAQGQDHQASWPELSLAEDEREGTPRKEEYAFTVQDEKGNEQVWRISGEDWEQIHENDVLSISSPRTSGESWILDEKGEKRFRVWKSR